MLLFPFFLNQIQPIEHQYKERSVPIYFSFCMSCNVKDQRNFAACSVQYFMLIYIDIHMRINGNNRMVHIRKETDRY